MKDNILNLDNRNVTISLTYQELQELMRDCVDYTMKTYSKEFDRMEERKMVNMQRKPPDTLARMFQPSIGGKALATSIQRV